MSEQAEHIIRLLKRYAICIGGVIVASCLAPYLWELEHSLTSQHLVSFPDAYRPLHILRPYLAIAALYLPALGAFIYAQFCGILDRYIIRQQIGMFLIILTGFVVIWALLEVQNTHGDFGDREGTGGIILQYYLVQIPQLLVALSPFVLLLTTLFTLGKLSQFRELIGMIQTGRGFFRIVAPIAGVAVFTSLTLGILNYHWAPSGQAQRAGLKDLAKYDSLTRARNVLYYHQETDRLWYVGLFPKDYFQGAPLQHVEITTKKDEALVSRLRAESASWDHQSGTWTLTNVSELDLQHPIAPRYKPQQKSLTLTDWPETPSQLISPGLEPTTLGIPELQDWIATNSDVDWIDQQPYETQFHARISKPWMGLITSLLAAPLGVIYSRKGAVGGIIFALVLCLLLFFFTEMFIAFGNGGYMPPFLAAWSAELIFGGLACILMYRRSQNLSIYQIMKKVMLLWSGVKHR